MTIKITTVKTNDGYLIQARSDGKIISVAQADAGDVVRRRSKFIEDWTETPGVTAVVAEPIPNGQVECQCITCPVCLGEVDVEDVCELCRNTGEYNGDCPCHGPGADGQPMPNGVCCREFAERTRHSPNCGNYEPLLVLTPAEVLSLEDEL